MNTLTGNLIEVYEIPDLVFIQQEGLEEYMSFAKLMILKRIICAGVRAN